MRASVIEVDAMAGILAVQTEVDLELERLRKLAVTADQRYMGTRRLHAGVEQMIIEHLAEYPADVAFCAIYRGPHSPMMQLARSALLTCLLDIEASLDTICGRTGEFGYRIDVEGLEQYLADADDSDGPAQAYLHQRLERDGAEIARARLDGPPDDRPEEI